MKKFKKSRIFLILFTVILAAVMSVFCVACDIKNPFKSDSDGSGNNTTAPDGNNGSSTDDKGNNADDKKPDGSTGGNTDDKKPDDNTGGNTDDKKPDDNTGGNTDENKPNDNTGGNTDENKPNDNTGGNTDENKPNSEVASGEKGEISASKLSIHFLELGNKSAGDSILIKCGNTEVLIDAGSQQSSATTIKSYINQYCTDNTLEYVISTHGDEDHISGLVGTSSSGKYNGVLYSYNIGTFIKFDNTEKSETTKSGGRSLYGKYLDAVSYAESRGTHVFTASQCYDQTMDGAQRQYYLDEERTVSINILYNYYYYNQASDENNHSVVTLLTEEVGGGRRNYLFTGDLEEDGERRMVDYYKSVPADHATDYNVLPEVELYKAGHHGSPTSSTAKLMDVIKPKYVAVCCCCGSTEYTMTNANTFPSQAMIDNVGKYTDKIYVTSLATGLSEKNDKGDYTSRTFGGFTSMNGNIVFYSTGENLKLYCTNNDTVLKDTDWFKDNRTWPANGV